MYDTDEEIRRKRRTLIITIAIVIALILALIIFLLVRGGKKTNNNGKDVVKEMSCTIGVQGNLVADNNGVYHQPVTIEFKNIVGISKDYQIVKHTIGTVDRSSNKETFSATNSGNYHVYGFVQDSAGNRGKCELKFQISLSVPSCELEVTQGTLGDNGWYRSDVEVGFKSMSANNPSISIAKYYIDKDANGDATGITKAEQPAENIEKIIVTDNLTTSWIGHVIDTTGNEGVCRIEVKKDSTVPSCKLKVNSGTLNANGEYTDNPVIGLEEATDEVSNIAAFGIGISKNYDQETFTVTAEGKTTVVGYVKDNAGNEGTCSIEITRPTTQPVTPPTPVSRPSCKVTLSPNTSGTYTDNVKATLTFSSTNGATITSYGLAESKTYNGKNEITISNNGTHIVYGVVKDSNGYEASCTSKQFTINKGELLFNKVQVGDYVNYDAGTWTETRTEKNEDGYYWGMTSGTSKQTGVRCYASDSSARSGWMVLAKANNKVYLIHAGTPECVYHGRVSTAKVINTMMSEASKYVNTKYANGYTILACSTPGFDCNKTSYTASVFVTGTEYFIVQNGTEYGLGAISKNGTKEFIVLRSAGIRPIIQLRDDVKTSGLVNGVWQLQ